MCIPTPRCLFPQRCRVQFTARVGNGPKQRAILKCSPFPPPSGYTLANFLIQFSLELKADGGTVVDIRWFENGIGLEFDTVENCSKAVASINGK